MARPPLATRPASPLQAVSIATSPEAEDAAAALIERVTGEVPSIWSDETQWIAVVSAYLARPRDRTALKRSLVAGLKRIAACDLETAPARVSIRQIPARAWADSWKRHFKPIDLAGRLLVRPTWSRRRPRRGQAEVVLDPGLSFGTGQHATTRFCLDQLAHLRTPGKDQAFLDLGTGSGILAIAAAKLGFLPVEACDFDPACIRIARENAGRNGVENLVRPKLKDVSRLPLPPARTFDVIAANLMEDLLLAARGKITGRLAPNGRLVLAGILASQFPRVRAAYEAAGLRLVLSRREKEWESGTFAWKNPAAAR